MTLLIVLVAIIALVLLIALLKIDPFLTFLIVSISVGIALGVPMDTVIKSVEKGIGDMLGATLIIICLGAMLGKLVAESGATQRIASIMMQLFGVKYIQWGMVITGFIVGIPLFYGIGFILMVPLIFSIVYKYKLPAVYIGLPLLAALSVTHGFLPPSPSPTVLVTQFGGNMGLTLIYGIIIAIPAIIIGGPIFSKLLKGIKSQPLKTFKPNVLPEDKLPGSLNSFLTALLPVILLMLTTGLLFLVQPASTLAKAIAFLGDASNVMIISLAVATFSLGIVQGKSITYLMSTYGDAVKDVVMVLLVIAGAGALKQVLMDSGVSEEIAASLQSMETHPLILGWLIAAVIRVAVGSATVAGLTAAGIVLPLLSTTSVDPNLMALSIGAGSLVLSHVNDSGFWLFKEYFNLSLKDTFRSWTIMETIVAVVGLFGVLLLDLLIK